MRKLLVAAILLSMSFAQSASADTCVALPHTVAPDRLAALSRGFNADGWINGPKSAPASAGLLQQLRKAGMTHVRLPVPAERIMPRYASEAERDETLRALDQALKQLMSLGYAASVDLHPASSARTGFTECRHGRRATAPGDLAITPRHSPHRHRPP